MMRFLTILSCLYCCLILVVACKKKEEDVTVPAPTAINFSVPKGWPAPVYNFSSNPLTEQGVVLGRHLFYEGKLSKDGQFPCASCHQQFAAFATFDHPLSHGFNNTFTTRNAPGIYNLAWHSNFHADGGIANLDQQPLAPLTAQNEMAESIENVINKLRADEKYRTLFKAAFGDETINTQRMTKALSQFMVTMVSANSKYDMVKNGMATFSLPEQLGYNLFLSKGCGKCHTEPLFTDLSYRNTGLPIDPTNIDIGRMTITSNKADSLKFKVPSLRNLTLTYPYMHDGRMVSIDQVLEHYRSGVINGPTTDSLVRNKIPLSNFEIGQIKAFLYTLTDTAFVKNSAFSQPM